MESEEGLTRHRLFDAVGKQEEAGSERGQGEGVHWKRGQDETRAPGSHR